MEKFILSFLLFIIFVSQLFGQNCWDCPTENKAVGLSSISIGTSTSVTGLNSFVGGAFSQVLASNSFAYGNYAIVQSTAGGSMALGNNLKVGLPNSILIGLGIDKYNNLENNITNSIMLGVTAVPSLTIVRQSNISLPGYIGIGTTTPTELLSVAGNLLLESASANSGELKFKYNSSIANDTWVVFSNNTGLRFDYRTEGIGSKPKQILFLSNNEKVGIGTILPSERLHVTGNILSEDKIIAKNEIMMVPDHTSNVGWHIKRETSGLYFIYEAGGAIDVTKYNLYIENNGNVGLGTLSPTKKLDVNGDIKGSQLTLSGLSSNSGRIIKIGTGGLLTSSSISETSEGNIKIAGANNESKNLEVTGDISSNNITISSLNLNKSQVLKVGNDNKITTAVIYEYGGNVGIGQYATDPQEKLQIGDEWTFHDGTGDKTIGRNVRYAPMNPNSCYRIKDGFVSRINFTVMGGILLQVGDNNSAGTSVNQWHGISLVNNGYVGVATADPQEQFQIGDEWTFHNGDTKYIGRNIRNNGTDDVKIKQGVSNTLNFSSTGISLYTYDEGAAGSIVNRTGNITLLNNGNVGIGFISPTKKLQVNGDIYSSRDIWGEKIFANDGIGINTSTLPSGYKLAVNGKIICTEMKVKPFANWSDYVFEDNYKLKTLKEVEAFISENKHLPDVPSAKEVKENGIDIGEMQKILLQKIEELTLYTIEQQKQIMELNEQIKILQQLNNKKGGE